MKVYDSIVAVEKGILILIAGFTVYAVGQEMYNVLLARSVKLTDLLLLFIYAEVLGMVASFYKNQQIPIAIPIFIAITALSRLIILQGKEVLGHLNEVPDLRNTTSNQVINLTKR